MKNLILEEMDIYGADGVDFVPIFDPSKIPPIICSYTKEEVKKSQIFPRSNRKYWKMINGKKVYCDKSFQKVIEQKENKIMDMKPVTELKDTAEMMSSSDYKERFRAEYA